MASGTERLQTESAVVRERREKRRDAFIDKYGAPLGGLVDAYAFGVNRNGERLSEEEIVTARQMLAREVNSAITDGGFNVRTTALEALLEAVDLRSREASILAVEDMRQGL